MYVNKPIIQHLAKDIDTQSVNNEAFAKSLKLYYKVFFHETNLHPVWQ